MGRSRFLRVPAYCRPACCAAWVPSAWGLGHRPVGCGGQPAPDETRQTLVIFHAHMSILTRLGNFQ
eukprot:119378-Prymnesium_polylepis.1